MARNGSGQFDLLVNSWNPAINGVLATAGDYQALINDIAAALTQSVSRDGQTPMTGNLPMGNNKITGVAAGTGTGEALAFQQLFSQGVMSDLASTATTDIGLQNTNFLRITGNTTITSFGSNYRGPRFLVFEGVVTLTHSSTLVLPGNANITTAAGDVLIAIPGATLGTADKWLVVAYQKANTAPGYANIPGGFGFRNRLINANPIVNQRGYVSGTATTTANQYTLDRWRVVVSGQSVSWTDSGLTRTVTCPAGGLEQVIEGVNIEGGTFTLNWTGTATATVNGTAVLKGGTFTLPANTNATVRFSGGTLAEPQLEAGSVATPFERRDIGRELMMCQRYYYQFSDDNPYVATGEFRASPTVAEASFNHPVNMRVSPTITANASGAFNIYSAVGAPLSTSFSVVYSSTRSAWISCSNSFTLTQGTGAMFYMASGQVMTVSAEF